MSLRDNEKINLGPAKAPDEQWEALKALQRPMLPLTAALILLRVTGGNVYRNTVAAHVIERRRARNKMARKSRQLNRRSK